MTYPNISEEDWERLRELAADLVNADEGTKEESHIRGLLLSLLDSLEEKYGPHPKIFDSRADFLHHGQDPVPWRLKAYEICSDKDFQEKTLISSSLCQFYIEERPNKDLARTWLERVHRHSRELNDPGEIERAAKLKSEFEAKFEAEN
jgi:hypothetical protein